MARIVLPALAFIKSNPAAASAAFGVLDKLSFEARCRIYSLWRKDGAKHPLVAFARNEVQAELKAILRRLNAEKASIGGYGRRIGCMSHSHPLLVFDSIIAQVQQYGNMIQPIVDALKFQSLLSRDVISFVVLEGLAVKKQARKADGTNLAEWLSALAQFVGLFFKKYKDMDCKPLLEIVRNKLLV
jgi:THO complex subunit 2